MRLVLTDQLRLEDASLLGLISGELLRGLLGHLAGGFLRGSILLGDHALLGLVLGLRECGNLLFFGGILVLLGLQLRLGGLLELLEGLLLLLDGVESNRLRIELLLDLLTHLDFSLNALVGLSKCLFLTLLELLVVDALLHLRLLLDLVLLGLQGVDLSLLQALLVLTLLLSFALTFHTVILLLLLLLDCLLSTLVGVLLTNALLDLLLVGELVDGLEVGVGGIVIVALRVEDALALVREEVVPVLEAHGLRSAFSQ